MKCLLQHDIRDCGAVCLCMIADYYGMKLPIARCRELTKTDRYGTSLYGLVNGAEKIGLAASALSGNPDELLGGIMDEEIRFPFIAHMITPENTLHFVVVMQMNHDTFTIADPAKGKYNLPASEFFQQWTGHIVVFRKSESFKAENLSRGRYLKFFRFIFDQRKRLASIIVLSLLISAFGIMGTFIFQIAIDDFALDQGYYEEYEEDFIEDTEGEEEHEHHHENVASLQEKIEALIQSLSGNLDLLFTCLLCLYLLQALIQYCRGLLIIKVSKMIDMELTLSYITHILDLPVSSVSLRMTGEYMSRLSDCENIRQAISGATVTLLMDSLMAIAGGIILYLQSRPLFFIALLIVLIYAFLIFLFKKPIEDSNREVMERDAALQSYLKESIDGIETIKAANAVRYTKTNNANKFSSFLDGLVKSARIGIAQDTLVSTSELIGIVFILWTGFSMVLNGKITIGVLITFYMLLAYFTEPIKNLIGLQPMIQTALVAADRLNDILDLPIEQTDPSHSILEVPDSVNEWNIKNVDFRYGNYERCLKDISLCILKGERIAIVGESGSGKTTIAKLLLHFYSVESGSISIDGNNIENYPSEQLRESIGYVGQNTFFFADTIMNNLTLGRSDISIEEIEEVCEKCCLKEFIDSLPQKYNTFLEEGGANLSGGQRQRLAIVRALLRHPQLLILDEATSNLDTITESLIRESIIQLSKDLSVIIIAHRLATIKSCDRIYVMKKGEILESGTFEELMRKNGELYRLWNSM